MVQPNPFTPKSGQEPRVFMGRENEIDQFKNILEKMTRNYADHFLVLGDWGVGKTTLLKEFRNVAQSAGILTSFVSIEGYQKGDKVQEGIKDLVTQIPQGLPTSTSKLKAYAKQIEGLGIQILGSGVKFTRAVDYSSPILLSDTLMNLWKDLNDETPMILVLLDDVQNYDAISEIFTTFKNVLSSDKIIKETKILFGLACTMSMWAQFLQRHHPIGRYFTPRLKLSKLTQDKTHKIISTILKGTGVTFEELILKRIYEYTEGHPYELQVICSHLYNHQIGGRVSEAVWEKSLLGALIEVGEVVFDSLYQQASSKECQILQMMADAGTAITRGDLANISTAKGLGFIEKNISTFLRRLTQKGLVSLVERHNYALLDRFFREYLISLKNIDIGNE